MKVKLNLTRLRASKYIDCTVLIKRSSTPSFLKTHHKASLRSRSKTFSKSTNATLATNVFTTPLDI